MKTVYMHPRTKEELDGITSSPSHSILMIGRAGAGKGFLARYLSEKLTSSRNNIRVYDGAESGIDNVREIISSLKLKTLDASKRVIIIENIDKLGHEAQNALLKVLEEPPDHTYFVATAAEQNSVLPTVASRMTLIHVRPINLMESKQIFKNIANSEDITKAHHLSGGEIALMTNILSGDDHSLNEAIEWGKDVLRMSRYERLLLVDDLSKTDKDQLKCYIGAIQKILRASILHGKSMQQAETKRRVAQLEFTALAQENLRANVSPKLVLSNLFLNL